MDTHHAVQQDIFVGGRFYVTARTFLSNLTNILLFFHSHLSCNYSIFLLTFVIRLTLVDVTCYWSVINIFGSGFLRKGGRENVFAVISLCRKIDYKIIYCAWKVCMIACVCVCESVCCVCSF